MILTSIQGLVVQAQTTLDQVLAQFATLQASSMNCRTTSRRAALQYFAFVPGEDPGRAAAIPNLCCAVDAAEAQAAEEAQLPPAEPVGLADHDHNRLVARSNY